jgi:tRNA-dihydrouridine synthase B
MKVSQVFWQKLKPPILALAPMAGITDSAFRELCRHYGADVVYTEMVSADGLYYDSRKTLEFLKLRKSEHPVVVQLFGKHPEKFTKAAQLCERAGFDGIDINFGCPAKKVAGHGGGVTLMRDLPQCRQIIEAVLLGTKLPVSVKLRSAINKESGKVTALDFLRFMKELPLAAIMIHGRSYEKPFEGEPDYAMIKKCVQYQKKINPRCVIIGNGGIKKPIEAKKMINLTGVDGIALARGLYGRPYLFEQVGEYLRKRTFPEYDLAKIKKAALLHAQLAYSNKGKHGLVELRKHLCWYVSGLKNAKDYRQQLVRVESLSQVKAALKNIK